MRMFLLGMIALISVSASAAETFSAAAATADITPQKWPVPMVGSFSERLATHAWDPLKARALVLDNGTTRLGFVVVDVVTARGNCLMRPNGGLRISAACRLITFSARQRIRILPRHRVTGVKLTA